MENSKTDVDMFQLLFENHPVPMWVYDLKTLAFLKVNEAAVEKYGYSEQEFLNLTIKDIRPLEDVEKLIGNVKKSRTALQHSGEWRHQIKNGNVIDVEVTSHTLKFDERACALVMAQDVTLRNAAADKLIQSEKRYQSFFENSPIPLWEQDFSEIKKRLDVLKKEGVKDFRNYFSVHPEMVRDLSSLIKILDFNQAAMDLYEVEDKQLMFESAKEVSLGELQNNPEDFIAIAEGRLSNSWDGVDETFTGKPLEIKLSWSVVSGHEHDYSKVIVTTFDITESKQIQQALQKSTQRYLSLFEDSPVSLWEEDFSAVKLKIDELKRNGVTDFESYVLQNPAILDECTTLIKILDVNSSSLHLFNAKSKVELINNFNLLIVEEPEHQFKFEFLNIAKGLTHFEWEAVNRKLSGELMDIHLTWYALPGYEESLSKVIVSIVDITESKRIQAQLQKSEQRYRSVVEDMPAMVCRFKEDGTLTFINSFYCEYFKKSHAQLLGSNLLYLIPEEERGIVRQKYLSLNQEKQFITYEYKTADVDGKENWQRWTDRALFNEQGEIVEYQSIGEDITERKKADEQLRKSEEYYRKLTESFPNGIVVIFDQDLRVKFIAGSELTRYKYKSEDFLGKSYQEIMPPETLNPSEPHLHAALQGVTGTYEAPYILGNYYFINVAPLYDADGNVNEVLLMGQNITERKKAEEERQVLIGELAERVRELETLYESGLVINQFITPKEVAQKVIEVLERKMKWHHIAVREFQPESNQVKLIGFNKPTISQKEAQGYIQKINSMISNPTQGLSGWVTTHGKSLRVPDVNVDERYVKSFPNIHSGLYVPLKVGKRVIGSISVESEKPNAFSENDERLLETLAGQAAVAIEKANLLSALQAELIERRLIEEEVRQLNLDLEKRVEERTAQSEATKRRLELATRAGEIGVWEYIPRENKAIWDERMHIMHEVALGEFDGTAETWTKYIYPLDLEKSQMNIQLAFTQNLLLNNEHRIILPDGSLRYIATSATAVFTEDNTSDRIIGISRDITERKKIEQSLQESEAYARLLFDAAPDPVSVSEADGTMIDVNKFFEIQHQIKRDDLRGKHISELNIFPPEELDKASQYIRDIMMGNQVPPAEVKFYALDNGLHTLELHSYPIDVKGKRLVLSTSRDITAHKKLEEALKLANAEMENALRVKDEFLANMSHELRTPLNAILGISESLEEQVIGTLNEKQIKYVGIVKESGKHLLELINDILDISKIEAGRMELDFRSISVEKLCQASLRMIKELAQKKSLHVNYKVNGNIKTIRGDDRRLKQVLVNLLSNAVKFTETGNQIGLEVTGYPEKNEVVFSVWDTGIGISEESLKQLFKPFVQLDAGLAREYQGTGLGLALVAQMIRLHGGNVGVQSKVGKGSRFTFTLPWQLEEQTTAVKITGELVLPNQIEKKHKGRILVVEDTDVVIALIRDYLTYKGYEVFVAHNGHEGIKMAKETQPDAILMDVMMPIMDGLEATQNIRKESHLQKVPIIALTALAMIGDRERCIEAGMTDYMSKPVKLNELTEMLEKYLP